MRTSDDDGRKRGAQTNGHDTGLNSTTSTDAIDNDDGLTGAARTQTGTRA